MKIERNNRFTFTDLTEKEVKNLLVLDLIRSKSVISRTEVSKDTGINMVSISNYIKSFFDNGLLYDKGPDVSTGGRKPELMELAAESAAVIGIGMDGGEADALLSDLSLKTIAKKRVPAEGVAKAVTELSATALSHRMKVKAVGLGARDEKPYASIQDLSDIAGAPAFAGADVFCAAFGEKTFGANVSLGDILYMHTSLGEGIVVRSGELISSYNDKKDGAVYLKKWGANFSAETMAKEEAAKGVGTKIVHIAGADLNKITENAVIEAMQQGDDVALGIIESVAINLGLRTAYLVNIFSPRAVIIGGGIEKAGEVLLSGVKRMIARLAHASKSKDIPVLPSALGSGGVAFGASALAVRELFLRS
jgi:predicted NBD/HSP70 family sugar kinase